MAPLSRRARRALAVGAGATVAYAAAVAYRRARDAALEAPDARTERLEEARALAALERELAALDEETLRGSGASAPPPPRRDHAGSSGDSLASGSGSGTSYADAERPHATASARDGDDATHGDVRRSAEPTFFPGTSRVTDASDEKEKDVFEDESSERAETKARTPHGSGSDSTPDFFASTKFFACLELEESRELFDDAAETIEVPPRTVVFRQGDDSSAGIYVVERGSLGVYLQEERETAEVDAGSDTSASSRRDAPSRRDAGRMTPNDDWTRIVEKAGDASTTQRSSAQRSSAQRAEPQPFVSSRTLGPPFLTNILREGESVGDIDVLDNAPRGVSVVAGAEGARLVRIGQKELFAFIAKHPRTLETYVTQAVARLWRVAHFVLVDFLGLPKPAAGDAVRLDGPVSLAAPKGLAASASARDAASANREPRSRVSPAYALMRHIDALEKHCPALGVDDGVENDEFHHTRSQKLYAEGDHATCMFLVLSGAARADATPWPRGDGQRGTPASAPALIGASAFLTRSARQETVRVEAQRVVASACGSPNTRQDATEDASSSGSASTSASSDSLSAKALAERSPPAIRVLAIGAAELASLRAHAPEAYVAVLLASTCSLSRLLRQFISLGLNRVWLRAGESAYVAGEQATSMFVLISGRVRLLRDGNENLETLEDEAEETRDGATRSARDAFGEDGSASSFRGARRARGGSEERGRGETIGEAPLLANGRYPSTATCLRDSELVRMSRGALTLVCARHPNAASRLLEAMARKLHATLGPAGSSSKRPDLVTIALVPASAGANEAATATLAASLRNALATNFGPTLWLDERAARDAFTDGTVTRLENAFYRSKLTGWMAQQEENYRFILLQADASDGAWSRVCVSQADRVVVVAQTSRRGAFSGAFSGSSSVSLKKKNDAADPSPSLAERRLLWRRRRGAAVELVLVHEPGAAPAETRQWRASRAEVRRHHMLRLSSDADVQRLARHVAGRAVGVVLTGGGGHGLAHLGALRALEDAGVPVDAVGGTSRGALVAALYAKYASTTHMLPRVKELVGVLSSPRHLLADLTLPILSVFSGKGLDAILRKTLGEDDVEDLWLPFFCCSTNLTRGRLSTHVAGRAWRRVRASMTTLGLLPPVVDERGELLVDGGYLNAIPADVMRETMGADVVIVVDVEDDDYLAFRDLTPRDGGLGGWRLLWERVDPLAGARATARDAMRGARDALQKAFPSVFSIRAVTPRSVRVANDAERRETSRTSVSYASLLSALLHATSSRQFAQASREHAIDLYLRPPGVSGWTAPLTPRRVDALVRRAHAHSCVAVEAWRAREARAAERAAAADGTGAPAGGRQVDAARPDDKSAETRHGNAIGAPRAPRVPARRSLELAVDRTGRADRDRRDPLLGAKNAEETDCPYVEGVEGVEGPATPVANAASSIVTRSPRASHRSRVSVTLPPPLAPGADEAVTRLRTDCPYDASSSSAGSFGSGDATGFHSAAELFEGACVSSVKETKEGVEKGVESPGDGAPRKGSETRKGTSDARAEKKTAKAEAETGGAFDAIVASSLLYRSAGGRHVRRHSAHVDAVAMARALRVSTTSCGDAGSRQHVRGERGGEGLPGAPVFGALLARRAEEEDRWRRAFGGADTKNAAPHSGHGTLRRRSLSAGDLVAALGKEDPPAEVASRGFAA